MNQTISKTSKISNTARVNRPRRRPFAIRWAVPILVVCAFVFCLRPFLFVPAEKVLLRHAARAFALERYAEAEDLAKRVLEQSPNNASALLIAGESARKLHRSENALGYFQQVGREDPGRYVHAQCAAAKRWMILGRAATAEQCLRSALEVDADHVESNETLAKLLQIEGRTFESIPNVLRVIQSGKCGRNQLLMIGATERNMVSDFHFVDTCVKTLPDDPVVQLGWARMVLINGDLERAEEMFREIIAFDPKQAEAQARLGEILLEQSKSAEFLKWHSQIPEGADSHPGIWHNRGLWALRNGQRRASVRCFLEAVLRDPNYSASNYQLSQILVSMGEPSLAKPFAERASLLAKLDYFISELKGMGDLTMMRQAVELQEQLGRLWEAMGWCHVALYAYPDAAWAHAAVARLDRVVDRESQLTVPSCQPALRLDPADYPLPVWPDAGSAHGSASSNATVSGNVTFVNSATDAGVQFDYYNGTTATSGLEHMLQSTGAGVAVIDYDADGWPDLYFAQSGPWEERDKPRYRNRMFRNLGDGTFEDVTEQTGLGDGSFSQGVAVGDFNSDGLPDLYLGNIGPNRLYANNGDGTFRDVTQQAGASGDEWTVSCAIVDLNGDAMPEIYTVSYLVLKEVMERMCKYEGMPMGCAPSMFTAEQDRLYHNLGDGRFRDVTVESGIQAPDGKGLGVVAADFEGNGRINIFVSNDTTANPYYVNETAKAGAPLKFTESGIMCGVAFDETGQAQSCMGIASGDVNNDGRLDLFVTNFYNDSNTLYQQLPGNLFVDDTRSARLRQSSINMLGFGTQMLDGDLDGHRDIVITNGHVDRTFATGAPDLMPPKYYRNLGNGRFADIPCESLGGYFQHEYLGRSLVILDWNRDGREDFCVSHLDAPAALLTNQAPEPGHHLVVKLHGVVSNRDAVGAIVTVTSGETSWTRQMIAGHGYLASNHRQLVFGLGTAEQIDHLTIRWPSGLQEDFIDLPVDVELVFVEGSGDPVRLWR